VIDTVATPSMLTELVGGSSQPPSVVLSFGMGLDSASLLLRWLAEPSTRDFDLEDLVVISAMTGHEFSSTRQAVETHVLPRLRAAGVRFVQVARSQRRTTRAGDGVVVLDDSRCPQRLYAEGLYTLGQEMLSAGTVPQRGGIRGLLHSLEGQLLGPGDCSYHEGSALPARHRLGGQ
jgi:hypothetical protein